VTGVALYLRVRPVKWKLGLVMVKARDFPFAGAMASLTLGAIPAGMDILDPVASYAGSLNVLVAFASVTGGATDLGVGPLQRKLRFAMVERFDLPPTGFIVAVGAPLAEAALVGIVGLVTIKALLRGLAVRRFCNVTSLTLGGLVHALEFKVGKSMIECLPVKLDDVRRSAFVFAVTVLAIPFGRIGMAAVKPGVLAAVCGNLFVAIKTKLGLRCPREWLMTLFAFLFELDMGFGEWAGHNQLFQQVLCAGDTYRNH
jgi:hypothetical protein